MVVRSLGIAAVALSLCALFATSTPAFAQKKITYAEAFKRCKAFMDKEKGGFAASTTNEQMRTARGASCMRKFGYKL
jgi:hypothetical protein